MQQLAEIILYDTSLSFSAFIILCVVSFIASFITATLGLGGGMLMLAVMALYLTPSVLIPLHGAVQLGSNAGRAALMYRHVIRQILPWFVLGSLIGALIGGQLVVSLPVSLLKIILALFIFYAVWAPRFKTGRHGNKTFLAVGIISSFVTMFVGATGPLVAPFIAAVSPERHKVVATHAIFMTLQHLIKITIFTAFGFAFKSWLPVLAALLLTGFAGTYAGRHVLTRLPEQAFRIGLKAVLTGAALKLLWGVLVG